MDGRLFFDFIPMNSFSLIQEWKAELSIVSQMVDI
jgi:hypothetical protein